MRSPRANSHAGPTSSTPGSVPAVAGAVAIVVLLVLIPVGFLASMTAVAGLLGATLTKDAAARHEGSELVALNR